jgi:dUTP pyrophosphatase
MANNTTLETIGGVIDNGYTGELFIVFANYGKTEHMLVVGQKIAQLVLIPVANFPLLEVDEIISADGRGNNGFGSTDPNVWRNNV